MPSKSAIEDLLDDAISFNLTATWIASGDHAERMGADGIAHCHACDTTEDHQPWCPVPLMQAWVRRMTS